MANNRYRKRKKPVRDNYVPPFDAEVLEESASNLTFKAENTLALLDGAGIKTIGDVVKREEKDFYRIPTFKKRNLFDVLNAVKERRLFLKPAAEEKPQAPDGTPENKAPERSRKNPRERQQAQRGGGRGSDGDRRGGRRPSREEPRKQAPPEPQDIYIKVNKGGKWGFSDRAGKIVVEPEYDEVFLFKEELCAVEKDELFGFINREGEEIVPLAYECALSFSEGLACVYKGGKCGYINAKNDIVIDFKFDAGTSFENGSCRIKRDGKWGELTLEKPAEIRWIN